MIISEWHLRDRSYRSRIRSLAQIVPN